MPLISHHPLARMLASGAFCALAALLPASAFAEPDLMGEDIDIFLTNPTIPSQVPNVLIILDNTANWSRQSQQWPAMNDATCLAAGMTGNQQGDAETCALYKTIANLRRTMNVGLMMLNDQDRGAYVRFPMKAMGSTNRTAFRNLLATIQTNNPAEKTAANANYENPMNDAFRYLNSLATYGGTGAAETLADDTGYTSSAKTQFAYTSSLLPTNTCGYDYIIFIGNGFPTANKTYATELTSAAALLGDASNITVNTTPLQSTGSNADLWSQFMYEYGTKIGSGVYRHVTTYTLDVCNAQCETDQATLLQSMANISFGRYFKATNLQAIEDALNTIFAQIQSVNSVFAAATLPVSINVRGTNLNQVYIGVFRPDSNLSPRWHGNLKQYQLGLKEGTTDTLELKDSNGAAALNLNTGFVANTAASYWTATSTFWSFQSPYTISNVGDASDSPDGDIVEKGGAAQQIRTVYANPDSTTAMTRNIYTCTGACLTAAIDTAPKNLNQTTDFTTRFIADNANVTSTMLGTYATSNISSLTATGTTATATTASTHSFVAGDVITVAGAVPTLYTGNFTVLASPAPTSNTFSYTLTSTPDTTHAYVTYPGYPLNTATDLITVANASPSTYDVTDAAISAVVGNANQFSYTLGASATSAATGYTITAKRRISAGNLIWSSATNRATVTLVNHGYSTSQNVTLSGVTDPVTGNPLSTTLNGTFSVTVVNSNTFTYAVSGTPAGGGTTTGNAVGSAPSGFTWANGDTAIISGGSGNYNTVAAGSSITNVSGNNFTYTTSGTVSGTATGTISAIRSVATDIVTRSISGTPTIGTGANKNKLTVTYGTASNGTTGQLANTVSIGDPIAILGLTCSSTTGKSTTNVACSSTAATTCAAVAAAEYSFTISAIGTGTFTYTAPADMDTVSNSSGLVCWKGQTLSAAVSITSVTAGSATVTGGGTMYASRTGDLNASGRVSSITSQGIATGTITAGISTNSDPNERENLIAWVRGKDNKDNENENGVSTDVRASVHGDVLHSRPAVVNYNRTAGSNDDVYVFYGSNDGMLHAIKGGQASGGGQEQWAFIPTEFYGRFKRARNQNPALASTSTRDYFFDGPLTAYTKDATSNFSLGDSGDQVKLFVGLRRGGRMLYALDVTDPTAPKFLWKKGCTVTATGAAASGYETPESVTPGTTTCDPGYREMGQTWSEPKLGYLRAYGNARLVIIVGAGYDAPVEDLQPCGISAWNSTSVTGLTNVVFTNPLTSTNCPPTGGTSVTRNRSMGRGVYIIDAANGDVLWRAVSPSATAETVTGMTTVSVTGMDYAITADVTAIRNRSNTAGRGSTGTESVPTGYLDRIYAADTGGNLWRIDVGDASTANWVVNKIATIAPTSGTTRTNMRKFMFQPDVVYSSENGGATLYDAVLLGSGDREHPFDQLVTNRFYMFKDYNTATIGSSTTVTAVTESNLVDTTSNCLATCTDQALSDAQAALLGGKGWYMTLSNTGEKTIAPATTAAGSVIFNTNQPKQDTITGTAVNVGPNATGNSCVSDLGTARQYGLNFKDATGGNLYTNLPAQNRSSDGRSATFAGGGFLPQPVPVVVDIGGKFYQTVISGVQTTNPGGLSLQSRARTYWYKRTD